MDAWGNKLLATVNTVAETVALGFGLERGVFTEKLDLGPHLLAPTGGDLEKNDVGAVFAGFHYDMAFLSIHGKSRFPALYCWLRHGQKLAVQIPDGCLLL